MKKAICIQIITILLMSMLAGCGTNSTTTDSSVVGDTTSGVSSNNTTLTSLDYSDAKSFEKALNDGEKVAGKTVQFDVQKYNPKSGFGVNCWSGEHLNFISENELDVKEGSIVVGRITEEPAILFGSWIVFYEVLEIKENKTSSTNKTQSTTTTSTTNTETQKTTSKKITVTMSEEEFKNLTTADAEKKLKAMGFTTFKYDTLDAGSRSDLDGKVGAVEIKSWEFGKGDFTKGDTYNTDAIVVLWTYKYTEPEKPTPVFYSTNDYETAKKGNTGVFSYKNKNGSYDVYWIIDFDAGYVYYFTDGNGENTCDKVKIVSGDLNDRITATWHDGGDQWSWFLHFKYKNHPETLVVNDHNGFDTEFTTTDLDNALSVRNAKTIKAY